MGQPLISIIVPAYNIEQYIGRCINSILNQTYKNVEIIVVNDGSNDRTGKIIDEFVSKYNYITAIHKKNEGVSIARNIGIDIAKGDYIGFVDGDDIVDEDMFETLIKNALDYDADISHCGYKMVFPDRIDYYYNTKEIIVQDNKSGLQDLLEGIKVEPGLCNKLYKRELFEGLRLDSKIKINEDTLMNFYLFSRANKSIFYDKAMYHYMIRKNSATKSSINKNQIEDPLKVMEEIKDKLEVGTGLYIIAYNRYIRNIINVCRNSECRKSNDYRNYIIKSKNKLKEELAKCDNLKIVDKKLKYMAYGILYCDALFLIIDNLHGIITRNKFKYEIK